MRKRISSLNSYIFLVEGINSQIAYSKKNIIQIINELVGSGNISLHSMIELAKEKDIDFDECWKDVIVTYSRNDGLNKSDEKILLSFGSALGTTDIDGQNNNCKLHADMLKKQLLSAESELKSKSKIVTAMSICSGFIVLIILF